jgi:hypothetical protein
LFGQFFNAFHFFGHADGKDRGGGNSDDLGVKIGGFAKKPIAAVREGRY